MEPMNLSQILTIALFAVGTLVGWGVILQQFRQHGETLKAQGEAIRTLVDRGDSTQRLAAVEKELADLVKAFDSIDSRVPALETLTAGQDKQFTTLNQTVAVTFENVNGQLKALNLAIDGNNKLVADLITRLERQTRVGT